MELADWTSVAKSTLNNYHLHIRKTISSTFIFAGFVHL
jgi:hypothetical protein